MPPRVIGSLLCNIRRTLESLLRNFQKVLVLTGGNVGTHWLLLLQFWHQHALDWSIISEMSKKEKKGGHNLSSWQPHACSCQLSISALTLQDQSYEIGVVSPPPCSFLISYKLYGASCQMLCFLWSFITALNVQHVDMLDFSTQSCKRDLLHWVSYLICFDNRARYEPSTKWYGTFMLRCQLHQERLTCD